MIEALPLPGDPLAEVLTGGSPPRIGMIAIEPATRGRMRVNGRVRREGDGLRVDLDQVVVDCPRHLQKREHSRSGRARKGPRPGTVTGGTELGHFGGM